MIYYNTADFDNIKYADNSKAEHPGKSGFRVLLVLFAVLIIMSFFEISSHSQNAHADNKSQQDATVQTVDIASSHGRPGSLRH